MIDDSGHAIFADIGHQYMLSSLRKTKQITSACRWLAPEIIDPPNDSPAVPTAASDVYSAAATLYEVGQSLDITMTHKLTTTADVHVESTLPRPLRHPVRFSTPTRDSETRRSTEQYGARCMGGDPRLLGA
jgi:hypothetical protein